jgi:uracil-DNA glycosylase family 4
LAGTAHGNDRGMRDELLGNLRNLLELDRGLGLEWMGRGGLTSASASTRAEVTITPVPSAPPVIGVAPESQVSPPSEPPVASTTLPALEPVAPLEQIAKDIASCRACALCSTRLTTVPGAGDARAEVLFVGEAPGAEDDASGQPFTGKDGELLSRMITAMGLSREQVFITNVIKCRPPASRPPVADEAAACLGFLHRQIEALRPQVICTLGNLPLRALLGDDRLGVTRLRGTRLDYRGIPLIPTFHPGFLLRNESAKKPCWEDLKQVLAVLGRVPPARG